MVHRRKIKSGIKPPDSEQQPTKLLRAPLAVSLLLRTVDRVCLDHLWTASLAPGDLFFIYYLLFFIYFLFYVRGAFRSVLLYFDFYFLIFFFS